jgi:hypothetical protein
MNMLSQLTLTMLAGALLAACTVLPDPNPSPPRVMNGKIYQPPPGGWPSYDKGGESGGGGGRN